MGTDSSLGMPTSAGSYALRNATSKKDAFIVDKLREAGLVILGKANLAVSPSPLSIRMQLTTLKEFNGFKYGS